MQRDKLIRVGQYLAVVQVRLIEDGGGWAPYLSAEDARKLDRVREALRADDTEAALKLNGEVFRLTPVAAA